MLLLIIARQWLVKIVVPSSRIHLFQLTKDFFCGKEVRKAQPFSGMLWLTWNFGHLPLKFVFCQCRGSPTLFSYVKHD